MVFVRIWAFFFLDFGNIFREKILSVLIIELGGLLSLSLPPPNKE